MRTYRRVEKITTIFVEDHVIVTDTTMIRTGSPTSTSEAYTVQWFNTTEKTEVELPESSAIYNFLETEFHKLPETE